MTWMQCRCHDGKQGPFKGAHKAVESFSNYNSHVASAFTISPQSEDFRHVSIDEKLPQGKYVHLHVSETEERTMALPNEQGKHPHLEEKDLYPRAQVSATEMRSPTIKSTEFSSHTWIYHQMSSLNGTLTLNHPLVTCGLRTRYVPHPLVTCLYN